MNACPDFGMSAVGAACEAGFFCTSESTSTKPVYVAGKFGPCQEGYYCPSGSNGAMTPCPAGTYLDAKFGSALTDCK